MDFFLRKDAPDSFIYGVVTEVDTYTKRVKFKGKNNLESWASYLPTDFPDLAIGNTVLVGRGGAMFTLVRVLPSVMATSSTVVEV